MAPAEKAQVLQWIARDFSGALPGIESTPDVAGGEPYIVRTRIPVWVLVQARKLGVSEADLLKMYPTSGAEDLINAWAYYRLHHHEIEQQIAENETAQSMDRLPADEDFPDERPLPKGPLCVRPQRHPARKRINVQTPSGASNPTPTGTAPSRKTCSCSMSISSSGDIDMDSLLP